MSPREPLPESKGWVALGCVVLLSGGMALAALAISVVALFTSWGIL